VSIRFKVILPYLLLTLIVAVTGAYVVTRLVTQSLEERLSNQLLEAGRTVSDAMIRQEVSQLEAARLLAYTQGLGAAVRDNDRAQMVKLAVPAMGSTAMESVLIYNAQGFETFHLIRQANGELMNVSQVGVYSPLQTVNDLLKENNANSLPKRQLGLDPVNKRYYYFTAIPVIVENQVVGIMLVGTSLDTILPYLKTTSASDVVFYDQNGQAIASTLGGQGMDPLFTQTISITKETYQEAVSQDDYVTGKDFEADKRQYSVAYGPLRIGDERLAVFAVVLPREFVVASAATSRINYAILYSIATAAVILLGFFIARLIINPLTKLVRTSRAIAEGDLSRRTEIKTNDEIGVLANTFDDMTGKLQQRTLELEHTYAVLEQMDRTKMRFIQVAAHELRTPLTLVQGYAQMTQLKASGSEDLNKYTKGILEGTSRMTEIIDGMLDVTRIDSNLLEVSYGDVQLEQVMAKVRKVFKEAIEERRINLHVQGLSEMPTFRADKDLLYKVLYQVVGNAIKYTPDGKDVTVSACLLPNGDTPEVEITVKDTGIGIDPQYHELVFEKFFQTGEVLLHSSGKTKFKGGGPGLGLAIARGIINAHNGRIWLESPAHDEKNCPGTTVFIRLPLTDGVPHASA
jgi:signal transduction histidine kinase